MRAYRFTADPVLELDERHYVRVKVGNRPRRIVEALLVDRRPPDRPLRRDGYVVGYWSAGREESDAAVG